MHVTGTNWRRLVPPPHFPTLWLAGVRAVYMHTHAAKCACVWRHLSEALYREGVQGRVAAEGLGEV